MTKHSTSVLLAETYFYISDLHKNQLHVNDKQWNLHFISLTNILGGSDGKNRPAMLEAWVQSLGQEDLLEKEMAGLENSKYGGARRATVHGVAKSRTRLSN